jgi:hypothetical protein
MGPLAQIYSAGDTLKRQFRGLLDEPLGTLQQFVNHMNDRSRSLNELTTASANEFRQTKRSGGPQTEKLAGVLADAYNPAGMVVWHGSPHKFNKFDASKIGTGEGKQQQGIGSYLAESEAVAQKYADKESWKRGMESGYLYKVDVPDSLIAAMANHDAPLSSQPKNVQDAVRSMLDDSFALSALRDYHGWDDPMAAPFGAIMDALEISKGNNRAATSGMLRQAGIPGIRYLDGGSRGTGQGTSNFVVFPGNEGLLSILERNGQPLP